MSATGEVVFRARASEPRGGEGEDSVAIDEGAGGESRGTTQGIYTRDMSIGGQPIETLAQTRTTLVPDPNNLDSVFVAVPSFPRIDIDGNSAFRGQSQPVWEFTDPMTGEDSRAGTSGVYSNYGGGLVTGASQLGFLDDFSYFAVPGTDGVKIEQFPGAPSPSGAFVTYKGNWTDENGEGQTAVFFRDVAADGGEGPTGVIAKRGDPIPNGGGIVGGTATFGSTAPPSASGGNIVFTGLDNEDAPTAGGIFIAPIMNAPIVTPLVDFSSKVPGEGDMTFNRFGEGLSFDGSKVAFWAAWGDETRTITLNCRSEGNEEVVAACIALSDKDPVTGEPTGTTTREVPVNQGIFTVDVASGAILKVAEVGEDGIAELVFWNFSGNASATEEEEGPRWRSSAFAALEGDKVAFKSADVNGVDAILLRDVATTNLETVLSTLMLGSVLDAMSPGDSLITELGIERDSLRGGRLAVAASFLNAAGEGWAGIYLSSHIAPIPLPATLPLMIGSLGLFGFARRQRRVR